MDLTLYVMAYCPFCVKVLRFLEEQGIEVPTRDIMEDMAARDDLMRIGGKTQVPCLVIDGQPLYESDDIIQWFKDHNQK